MSVLGMDGASPGAVVGESSYGPVRLAEQVESGPLGTVGSLLVVCARRPSWDLEVSQPRLRKLEQASWPVTTRLRGHRTCQPGQRRRAKPGSPPKFERLAFRRRAPECVRSWQRTIEARRRSGATPHKLREEHAARWRRPTHRSKRVRRESVRSLGRQRQQPAQSRFA